jgi:formylmethanofuran dehydrogenase subunit E
MTAEQPHPEDGQPRCQDCGQPFVAGMETDSGGQPFRVCRPCYDVYVDTAGHWPVNASPPASES